MLPKCLVFLKAQVLCCIPLLFLFTPFSSEMHLPLSLMTLAFLKSQDLGFGRLFLNFVVPNYPSKLGRVVCTSYHITSLSCDFQAVSGKAASTKAPKKGMQLEVWMAGARPAPLFLIVSCFLTIKSLVVWACLIYYYYYIIWSRDSMTQTVLELLIFLPLPPMCWVYRHVPSAWLSWFIMYYLWEGHSHTITGLSVSSMFW